MPCMTQPNLTPTAKQAQAEAVKRLETALGAGAVKVVIGNNGALAFNGWTERGGVSDLCAYRALSNSPALRKAIARAEAMSGRTLNRQAIAAGHHSHDGGHSWGQH